MKLSELEKGQRAIIDKVNLRTNLRERFSSVGIFAGITLRICRKTFGKDSIHVKLANSSCIALSQDEAVNIEVTLISGESLYFQNSNRKNINEECINPHHCRNEENF